MGDMDIVIYADIFLIINFCVDFVCLYISVSLLRLEKKALRLSAASLFGAVYALSTLFFSNLILHLVAAFLICIIAVKTDFFSYIKLYLIFFISALLTGGLFTSLYIHATANGSAFLAALPAAALIAYIYGKLLKKRATIRTVRLKLKYKASELSVTGLVDSGNRLCDPVSGDNVVIIKEKALADFPVPSETEVGVRFIPVKTAAGSMVFRGFRPDTAEIKAIIGRRPTQRKIIVAIDDTPGTFCGFDANIPLEIL